MAMVFAIAAEPGTMAMPAPKPAAMASMSHASPACGHMNQQKNQRSPCKGMSVCLGMLNCFGMAVIAAEYPLLPTTAVYATAPYFQQTASGLTLQPDNPPPIA
ncbi:MAG: hypothetical protein KGJ49_08555 [Alphaproteobacteria bacterium]|nr:hypothetical protein [Alphaproteobacteria bacterium]